MTVENVPYRARVRRRSREDSTPRMRARARREESRRKHGGGYSYRLGRTIRALVVRLALTTVPAGLCRPGEGSDPGPPMPAVNR
jgi:hypothetical protein